MASETFNPHIGGREIAQLGSVRGFFPCPHADAGPLALAGSGGHPVQRAAVIHPEAHGMAALRKVSTQAPAHADVAIVVDDLAEHIP